MATVSATDMDLSVSDPLDKLPDDSYALSHYPALKGFRRQLGNTPLVEAPSPPGGARILAKQEFVNPFGSVKDRAAYALVCDAITRHGDKPEPLRLVDFSGGNMARALGGLCALAQIPIRLAMPDATPPSLLRKLEADGVQIDFVDSEEFLFGIIQRAKAIVAEDPDLYILHQHRNVMNLAMHEFATGREILEQLSGTAPRYWVSAIGTGGTIAGVSRTLRRHFPGVSVVGVTPEEMPYGTPLPPNGRRKFAGAGGFGYGLRQPFVEIFVPDAVQRSVPYSRALSGMREFERLTGTRIGASAAANWLVSYEIAGGLSVDETVLTLFADAGTAEDWERAENLAD